MKHRALHPFPFLVAACASGGATAHHLSAGLNT